MLKCSIWCTIIYIFQRKISLVSCFFLGQEKSSFVSQRSHWVSQLAIPLNSWGSIFVDKHSTCEHRAYAANLVNLAHSRVRQIMIKWSMCDICFLLRLQASSSVFCFWAARLKVTVSQIHPGNIWSDRDGRRKANKIGCCLWRILQDSTSNSGWSYKNKDIGIGKQSNRTDLCWTVWNVTYFNQLYEFK